MGFKEIESVELENRVDREGVDKKIESVERKSNFSRRSTREHERWEILQSKKLRKECKRESSIGRRKYQIANREAKQAIE